MTGRRWVRIWFDGGDQLFVSGSDATLKALEAGKQANDRALKLDNPVGSPVWIDCEKVSCFSLQTDPSLRQLAAWLEPLAELGDELWPGEDGKEPWQL